MKILIVVTIIVALVYIMNFPGGPTGFATATKKGLAG